MRVAHEVGLVRTQDDAYQNRFLDTFPLVATLLAERRQISFLTDVADLPLRPTAVGRRWQPRLIFGATAASS
jgi:hypothetical protein